MLTAKELQVFESVGRANPQFTELLQRQLDKQIETLMKNPDGVQISRAQGACAVLQNLIEELNRFKNPR